jgi:hypothetical protein
MTRLVVLFTAVTAPRFGFFPVVGVGVKVSEKLGDFLALKSAVTPRGNAVCPDSSVPTPAPKRVRMDMEESGYFPDRQHVSHMFAICHIFPYLLFDYPMLTVTYFN